MQLRMYKPVNVVFMDEKNLTSKMFVGSSVPNEEYRICSIKQTPNFMARYKFGNKGVKQKGIVCLHVNIRSLRNKVYEVKSIIKDHKRW